MSRLRAFFLSSYFIVDCTLNIDSLRISLNGCKVVSANLKIPLDTQTTNSLPELRRQRDI